MMSLLLGGEKAKALEQHIDEMLHLVEDTEIQEKLETRAKVFDAWSKTEPFHVQPLPTVDEMKHQARQRERAQRSRFKGKLEGLKDSLLPE